MAERSDRYLRRLTEGSTVKVLAKEAREADGQTGEGENEEGVNGKGENGINKKPGAPARS
jgi:hypothetical protein